MVLKIILRGEFNDQVKNLIFSFLMPVKPNIYLSNNVLHGEE
jgi:hypothetical protein